MTHIYTPTSPLQAPRPKMSSATATATLTDATLEKLQKLTSSFAILALAMKQSSDEFKDAALEFSKTMEAVRAAAAAPALPPPIDTATPASEKAAKAVAEEEREHNFQEMEKRRQTYYEQYKSKFDIDIMNKHHRMAEYLEGCIRIIGGKRVLIYEYHAFEMPADRSYREPGPLIWLGAIDPDTKEIRKGVMVPPTLPKTAAAWPWH